MEQTEKKSNKKLLATIAIILVVAILAGLVGGLAYRKARGDISVVQANASHQSLNAGFTDVKIKDKSSALKAVESVKEKLGLTSAEKELEVVGTQKSGGNKYYRMQQYHDGLPVYGRQMVVGADEDGNSLSLTTNYEPIGGELSTDPSVDDATVRKNIEKQLKKESKKTVVTTKKTTTTEASTTETTKEEPTTSTTESTTEETTSASSGNVFIDALTETNLCIYNFLKDSTAVLAYALNVQNEAGNWKAIVDANSGEVLDLLSMTFTSSAGVKDASGNAFTASYNRSQDMYVLEDESLKTYIATFGGGNSHDGASCVILESEDNVFGNTSKEQNLNYEKGTTYYRTLTDIQKRFKSLYGAKADNILVALYDDSADYGDNGYATVDTMQGTPYIPDGTQIGVISLGMNKDVTAIDLIAHEYMHRVEQNKVGLYYRSESGAIMEAYSDVFGELLEADVNGSADWVHNGIRSLKNPADTENPEEYGGARWKSTSDDYDHGNVHNNSTVLSHAAYLMTTGVDGTNALSGKQLGVLWFEALNRFTPDETFEQAAAALYATAQDQSRLGRLSSDQVDTVASALATVGLSITTDAEELTVTTETTEDKRSQTTKESSRLTISKYGEPVDKNLWLDEDGRWCLDKETGYRIWGVWKFKFPGDSQPSYYYFMSGEVDKDHEGLAWANDTDDYYYVKNGKIDYSYFGLISIDKELHVFKNGKMQKDYNGTIELPNAKTQVVNGAVKDFNYGNSDGYEYKPIFWALDDGTEVVNVTEEDLH